MVSIWALKLKWLHCPLHPNPAQERAGLSQSANTTRIKGSQDHKRYKLQPETVIPTNNRNNQMARGKYKKLSIRNPGYLASSEYSSPTTGRPGYPNTLEKKN